MSTTEQTPAPSTALAKPDNRQITAKVRDSVLAKVNKGILHLPGDYSVENAMQHAWYKLQEVQNMNEQPLFVNGKLDTNVGTELSLINALTEYCTQGLNTAKTQAYFIVRKNKVCMDRSYMGDEVVAKRVKNGLVLSHDVVYEGESIEVEKIRSRGQFVTVVTKHKQIHPRQGEIVEAYCGGSVVDERTGEVIAELGFIFKSESQVKAAWSKGKIYKEGGSSYHNLFPESAWLKTVIRAFCKPIIATSTDEELLRSVRATDDEALDAGIVEEIESNANGAELSFSSEPAASNQQSEPEKTPETAKGKEGKKADPPKSAPVTEQTMFDPEDEYAEFSEEA